MLNAGNDVEIELIVRVANCLPCCFSCKTVSSASGCQRSFIIRKPFIKSPSCVPEQDEEWIPVHFSGPLATGILFFQNQKTFDIILLIPTLVR